MSGDPCRRKPACRVCLVAYCLCLCALLAACARSTPPASIPRADPGYLYWIEKQSILGNAPELLRIVSGSGLVWRKPSVMPARQQALSEAGLWLFIDPQSLLSPTREPVLHRLARPETLQRLTELGFSGLFLAHPATSGREWQPGRAATCGDDDTTGLAPSAAMGDENDMRRFVQQAGVHNLLIGGDALPVATGLGPDFFLAVRAVRDWPGAYCLVDVPREFWKNLPAPTAEKSSSATGHGLPPSAITPSTTAPVVATPLPPTQLNTLQAAGIIPKFFQDSPPLPKGNGWAATDEIRGQDGENRRWIYRFYKDPSRPILNWDDPSGAAQRMLAASLVQEVGVRRIPMVGLSIAPLLGLDAAPEESPTAQNLQPGASALTSLTRQVRHYGGWSMLRDALPLSMAPLLLEHGPDFLMDCVTRPAGEYALLTGDAAPLRAAFDRALALGIDQRRLIHPLSSPQWLDFSDLENTFRPPITEKIKSPLHATAPALALMRLKLNPETTPQISPQTLHQLLLLFRGGLPGLLALTGQDLTGITHAEMPLSPNATGQHPTDRTRGIPLSRPLPAWSVDSSSPTSTRNGLSRGVALYPPLTDHQGTFTQVVGDLARMRQSLHVPDGEITHRLSTRGQGSIAVLVRLPLGDMLLTAANFSDSVVHEQLVLPEDSLSETQNVWDALAKDKGTTVCRDHLEVTLAPYQCRLLYLPRQNTGAL